MILKQKMSHSKHKGKEKEEPVKAESEAPAPDADTHQESAKLEPHPQEAETQPSESSPEAGETIVMGDIVEESEEIAGLKADLAKVRSELETARDRMLRFAAELDNTRKRMRRDIDDARKRGREDVLKECLPALDSLDLSLKHIDETDATRTILDGVRLMQRQFMNSMSAFGLTRFDSKGLPFDPQRHEAVSQAPADDGHPPGTVIEELSKGYLLGDVLLRPAQVVVAGAPSKVPVMPENRDLLDGKAEAEKPSEEAVEGEEPASAE